MSIWRQLTHGLRALTHRAEADGRVDDELRDYVERATAAHVARGLTRDQASRAALLDVGNITVAREQVRTSGWEHAVETTVGDVRYALRRLRNSPGFTITAIATLALGIGASTAVFSAVNPILIEPLPFPHADRLVTLDDRNDAGVPMPVTLGTYDELRARSRAFDQLAAADKWQPTLADDGTPERLTGQRITANYFSVFGTVPFVGRGFTAAEDQPGGPHVVILSDGLLERRFAGDRSIIGRTIQLNGDPYVVVGVMPHGFANVVAPSAEIWTPMQERSNGDLNTRAWGHHYEMVGRLAASTTIQQATREVLDIGHAPTLAFARPSWAKLDRGLLVRSLQDSVASRVKPSLYAIVGAVLLLLAIAAVNVTNLLLARGARRQPEFAMRVALGAGGARLLRQLLTESVVLALCGGVLGLGVAAAGVHALVAASPPNLPRVDAIRVDGHVFLFALGLTTVVGLIVGLIPALGAARAELTAGLQGGSRRATGGHAAGRSALVVAEVALAIVLLVSAGLLFQSVRRLFSIAPGLDASHVVTMQVIEAGHGFDADPARLQFFQQALAAVQHVPGVTRAAFTSAVPLSGDMDGYGYALPSAAGQTQQTAGSALRFAVTPDYFATLRIPLLRGRLLDATDRPGAPPSVVINASMARALFKDANPIGQRIQFGGQLGTNRWEHVVGVVGDVKAYGLAADAPDAFYVADGQWEWVDNVQSIVVRTTGNAAALVPAIERAIWSVNANEPIQRVATMESYVVASAGQRRFALMALEAFAAAALLLAAIGLYGVISGSVTERIREIGIRTALGAQPADIVRGVVGRGLALTGAGAALGLAGAFIASRLLESMLFRVSRIDPLTDAAVVLLLAGVAVLAAWAPARRAAGVDPTIALRAE